MSKVAGGVDLRFLIESAEQSGPRYRQVYAALSNAIRRNVIAPGTRLPSTRTLAQELAVSRNTVVQAFELLQADELIASRVGNGSYVASAPNMLNLKQRRPVARCSDHPPSPLDPALLPAVFPHRIWARLISRETSRNIRLRGQDALSANWRLRVELAAHFGLTRGLQCSPEQILLFNSLASMTTVVAHALSSLGHLSAAPMLRWLPGFRSLAGLWQKPEREPTQGVRRFTYVAPWLGLPDPMIEPNREHDLVLEDDFGLPFSPSKPSLMARLPDRVLHLGYFSNAIPPDWRMAYCVAPQGLMQDMQRWQSSLCEPMVQVAPGALASFMEEGHWTAYTRSLGSEIRIRQRDIKCLLPFHARDTATGIALEAMRSPEAQLGDGSDQPLGVQVIPGPRSPSVFTLIAGLGVGERSTSKAAFRMLQSTFTALPRRTARQPSSELNCSSWA